MSIKSIFQRLKGLFFPQKHKAKHSKKLIQGHIKFFDKKKRFGFIVAENNEYFFHAQGTNPRDFKRLQDGVAVKFVLVQGKKGLQADKVEIVKE